MEWYVVLLRIALSIGVGLAIGIEREYKNRPAGMRTHVLVAMGACTVSLMECMFANALNPVSGDEQVTYNFGRLAAQVITGVGFLGAGTIFMTNKKIEGLTTAASLWNAACLGIAVGYGYYFIALVGGALVLVVLLMMQKIYPELQYAKIEQVRIEEPPVPDEFSMMLNDRNTFVFFFSGMDQSWFPSLDEQIRGFNKVPCVITTYTGDYRFTLYHHPDMPQGCYP